MKRIFIILLCLVLSFSLAACGSNDSENEPETELEVTEDLEPIEENEMIEDIEVIEEEPTEELMTTGQQLALERGKELVDSRGISYNYLVHELTYYNGFTEEEATFAADNCGADWYAEAVECATGYLENSPYDLEGIVSIMAYEGFTQAQTDYGLSTASGEDVSDICESVYVY